MNSLQRQSGILNILLRERHVTAASLASKFGVTERTIRNDITALSCEYPIQTLRGRYGGGIKLANWYLPYTRGLSSKQKELLKRLRMTLEGEDLSVLNSILAQFAPNRH